MSSHLEIDRSCDMEDNVDFVAKSLLIFWGKTKLAERDVSLYREDFLQEIRSYGLQFVEQLWKKT